MKAVSAVILVAAILGLASHNLRAVVYISNLAEPGQLENGLANAWYSQEFTTGTSAGGYNLNSVQLVAGAYGNPIGNFSVSIYSAVSAYRPIGNIGNLSGVNPSSFGAYTYTTTGISLLPSTPYFIVVRDTAQENANNYYFWNMPQLTLAGGLTEADLNYDSSDNWQIVGFNTIFSGNGILWINDFLISSPFQFEVDATPVPEPGLLSLAGIGLALAFFRLRK